MNAVEIEESVSNLALQPFDAGEFPYAFLIAFGNKDTTIKKLRSTKVPQPQKARLRSFLRLMVLSL